MAYPLLYVLRHGQTVWNAECRIQGALDSPLTELGRAQALAQRKVLSDVGLEGVSAWTSPQGRAFHTASIVLDGLVAEINSDARLREIGVGDWTGLRRSDLAFGCAVDESEESALSLYEKAPGGEGFTALHTRCRAFLQDLTGPSVIVTHGITSRMLRLIALGRGIDEIGGLQGGQGVVFRIENGVQTKLTIGA